MPGNESRALDGRREFYPGFEMTEFKSKRFHQFLTESMRDRPNTDRLVSEPHSPLCEPWRPARDLVSLISELSNLLHNLNIRVSEAIEEKSELFYVCEVTGSSRHGGGFVKWRFAGRVLFENENADMAACTIFADFVSLSRQLGLMTRPLDSFSKETCPENKDQLFELCRASRWAAVVCDEEGRILESNSSFEVLVGCRPREAEGIEIKEFISIPAGNPPVSEDSEFCLMRKFGPAWVRVVLSRKIKPACGGSAIFFALAPSSKVDRAVRFFCQDRAGLSRELHDGVAQDAAALHLFLATEGGHNSSLLTSIAGRIAKETQSLLNRLEGPTETSLRLIPALERLAVRYQWEHALQVELELPELPDIPRACELVVYRVTQESLRNVLLHSGAKRALVRLLLESDGLSGLVEDKGRGFVTKETRRLGIKGMRERCEIMGGTLRVSSLPGQGTTVYFRVPFLSRNT